MTGTTNPTIEGKDSIDWASRISAMRSRQDRVANCYRLLDGMPHDGPTRVMVDAILQLTHITQGTIEALAALGPTEPEPRKLEEVVHTMTDAMTGETMDVIVCFDQNGMTVEVPHGGVVILDLSGGQVSLYHSPDGDNVDEALLRIPTKPPEKKP